MGAAVLAALSFYNDAGIVNLPEIQNGGGLYFAFFGSMLTLIRLMFFSLAA